MRTIHYYVVNKETKKAVYANCREAKCREFKESLVDKENYRITYRWVSI